MLGCIIGAMDKWFLFIVMVVTAARSSTGTDNQACKHHVNGRTQ